MLFEFPMLADVGLLALRVIVGIVFFSSGRQHAAKPDERGDSIGMSPMATRLLGFAEMVAAFSIVFGVYIQIGALIIIMAMLGAIYKKIMVWDTGFYADKGFGWHYDAIFLSAGVLFLGTGGAYTLT